MRMHSYISAAALAAALLTTPHLAQAQGLDVDLGADVLGVDADASVELGGDELVDVDAGLDAGGDDGLEVGAGLSVGGSETDDTLVDADLGVGPNGGTLIDLGRSDNALVDANVDVLGGGNSEGMGSTLLTGDVRIAALGDDQARREALLERIAEPNLAEIDLDAAVDDTRVSILAAADLLGSDSLAEIEAAVADGGDGRTQLREALSASVELGAILEREGLALDDVLAVEIGEDGATQVIVLRDGVEVALLGEDGNLADATAEELADLDVDLLSRDELAEIDLDLLPDDLRTTAQLRLLGSDGDLAGSGAAELADLDLDLLSRDELAELDLSLLPDPVAGAVEARLLAGEGDLADVSVALLSDDDAGTDGGTGTGGGADTDDGTATGNGTGTGNGIDDDAGTDGGSASRDTGTDDDGTGTDDDTATDAGTDIGATAPVAVGASFGIAALDCDIGVLALANGNDATPQAIANAETLELVTIEGCERSLVDPEVSTIRGAIAENPEVSSVLDDASIPLEEVIGATIQGGTLTVFVESEVI